MFRLIIYVSFFILTTDIADGRYIKSVPEGISVHNVIQTWAEAQSRCATEGAVLASPINETVFNSIKDVIDVKNTTFYIGVKAYDSNGHFVSVEGIPIEHMTVAMINMSPQLDPLDGDCLAMNSDSIRVVPCWSRLPYMCLTTENKTTPVVENTTPVVENTTPVMENTTPVVKNTTPVMENTTPVMENTTPVVENTTPVVENTTPVMENTTPEVENTTTAVENITPVDGYILAPSINKYYKLHEEYLEWDEAQMACVAEGAHLVTIVNEDEATFIKNMYHFGIDGWIHIGLRLLPNGWESIQGQPVTGLFNKWLSGTAPAHKDLLCGSLHESGLLDDMYCYKLLRSVCQKDTVL